MNNSWTIVLDFSFLSLFIIIAILLKAKLKTLSKLIIPTSILAGFIGLFMGPEILNIVPLDSERLGRIVYHLMAIGFISLSLKERESKRNKTIVNSGIYIVSTYVIQGILGFSITLFLINTIYPDLFSGFGLLLPLGYGQGPGQAYSMGSQWEELGFISGGNIGLTIATFGFIWATIIGVPFMNILVKNKRIKRRLHNSIKKRGVILEEMDPEDIPLSESLDKISIQLSLIGVIYLGTYLTLLGLSKALSPLGTFGETLSQLLWGFHFNIGSIYAILTKVVFDKLRKKEVNINFYPNNYILQRIAGGSFDFMITASIAAISIYTFKEFVVPIMIITTMGGILTIFYTIYIGKKVFKENTLENIIAFYGMQTGTISTGMALLKGVDSNFETDAAENLVIGSAVALIFGFPLMIILNVPIVGYINNQPEMYLYTLLSLIAYLIFLYILLFKRKTK